MIRKIQLFALILAGLGLAFCSNNGTAESTADKGQQKTELTEKSSNKNLIPDDRFTGKWLDGTDFDSVDFRGQRLLLGFFSYKHKDALPMITAFSKISDQQQKYNFKIVLVSLDSGETDKIKQFIESSKITLPVIVEDAGLGIAEKFKITSEVTMIGLSGKHVPYFGIRQYVFTDMEDGENFFIQYLKENLNIPSFHGTKKPQLGIAPTAPDFQIKGILDGKTYKLSDYKGKKVVLVLFFSPKCPHCQNEMKMLRDKIYPKYKDKGLEILALSVIPMDPKTLEFYKAFKFPWPMADDSKRVIRNQYSKESSIPENFFVDKEGKIQYHSTGYGHGKDNLVVMQLNQMLGLDNPPLLSAKKFNGAESCMICHKDQYNSWSVTPHAHAWQTLQIKGEDGNKECVGCHSVGFNDPKGYKPFIHQKTKKEMVYAPETLQNVQCENCHGLGGPHITKEDMMARPRLEKTCKECHTAKFSLHFDFDKRIHKVNHSDKEKIKAMDLDQRVELLKKVSKNPDQLFDTSIKYTGSGSCKECHGTVYEKWSKSGHGHAFETLKTAGKTDVPKCLKCHTVGYGESSGYLAHAGDSNFESVGCESCHGPGEKHIKSQKRTDIRVLGDDCPFCVVEQICLSCHDFENSPEFNIHKGLEEVAKEHGLEKASSRK